MPLQVVLALEKNTASWTGVWILIVERGHGAGMTIDLVNKRLSTR